MTDEVQAGVVDGEGNAVDVAAAIANDGKLPTENKIEYPEWLPEKFRNGDDWQEKLGKSYNELEKTLKEKGKVAPDEYALADDLPLNKDDDDFKGLVAVAKTHNLSNEALNDILKYATESGYLEAPPDPAKEKAALGADADVILESLDRFAQTRLNEAEREVLLNMTYTADQVKLLNKIIRMSDKSVPPKVGETAQEGKKDLQKKLNELLSDPNIRGNREKQQEAIELSQRIASSKS